MKYIILMFMLAQTAGEVVDTELTSIRAELNEIRLELETLNPENLPAIAALGERLDAIEAQVIAWESPDSIAIENLTKISAWDYFRIAAVELVLDPTGVTTKCRDTGGTPDILAGICTCPVGSTWNPEGTNPGCTWDNPGSQVISPEPIPIP